MPPPTSKSQGYLHFWPTGCEFRGSHTLFSFNNSLEQLTELTETATQTKFYHKGYRPETAEWRGIQGKIRCRWGTYIFRALFSGNAQPSQHINVYINQEVPLSLSVQRFWGAYLIKSLLTWLNSNLQSLFLPNTPTLSLLGWSFRWPVPNLKLSTGLPCITKTVQSFRKSQEFEALCQELGWKTRYIYYTTQGDFPYLRAACIQWPVGRRDGSLG